MWKRSGPLASLSAHERTCSIGLSPSSLFLLSSFPLSVGVRVTAVDSRRAFNSGVQELAVAACSCSQGIFSIVTGRKVIKYSDDMSSDIPYLKDCTSDDKSVLKAEVADFCHRAKRKNFELHEDKTERIRFSLKSTPEIRCSRDPKLDSWRDGSQTFRSHFSTERVKKIFFSCARSLLYRVQLLTSKTNVYGEILSKQFSLPNQTVFLGLLPAIRF